MSEVIIHDDENFECALKRFRKRCDKAGVLAELRGRWHYQTSIERKRKVSAAVRNNRRAPR